MSDTPRTDENARAQLVDQPGHMAWYVDADVSRQLERELTALKKTVEVALDSNQATAILKARVSELNAERDALRADLREMAEILVKIASSPGAQFALQCRLGELARKYAEQGGEA